MQLLKEAKMKHILSLFEMTTLTNLQLNNLEEAVKTLHDMPAFGRNIWSPTDKWPTAVDLLKMPTN